MFIGGGVVVLFIEGGVVVFIGGGVVVLFIEGGGVVVFIGGVFILLFIGILTSELLLKFFVLARTLLLLLLLLPISLLLLDFCIFSIILPNPSILSMICCRFCFSSSLILESFEFILFFNLLILLVVTIFSGTVGVFSAIILFNVFLSCVSLLFIVEFDLFSTRLFILPILLLMLLELLLLLLSFSFFNFGLTNITKLENVLTINSYWLLTFCFSSSVSVSCIK